MTLGILTDAMTQLLMHTRQDERLTQKVSQRESDCVIWRSGNNLVFTYTSYIEGCSAGRVLLGSSVLDRVYNFTFVWNPNSQYMFNIDLNRVNNWMAPGKNRVTAISTEIFKYVRIHPNFASRPVRFEKMFLCCFFQKAGRKDLTNRPEVLSPPHPTPPVAPFLLKMLNLDTRDMRNPVLHGKKQWGGERELWACLSSLSFLLSGKNNTGTSFHITQVGLWSLGGLWHTWKFQSKWRLCDSCPEPFNYSTCP